MHNVSILYNQQLFQYTVAEWAVKVENITI